jgi:hypothetical protein
MVCVEALGGMEMGVVFLGKKLRVGRCECGMRPVVQVGDVWVEVGQEGKWCFWCGKRRVGVWAALKYQLRGKK